MEKKIFIISLTSLFTLISIVYSLFLPNIYISSALLTTTDQNKSNMGMLSQYSSMASLAGISIPSNEDNKTLEAIERIKSFDFFNEVFYLLFCLRILWLSEIGILMIIL